MTISESPDIILSSLTRIDPTEIDSEAHNVELNKLYPLKLYEEAEKEVPSSSITNLLDMVSNRLESPEQYENYNFSNILHFL